MQKRGQIYLLAALIIGLIIFLLVTETNTVKQTVIDDDFESLAKNYELESAKFMNSIIGKNTPDVATEFLKFTIVFSSYAKTKNPEFGLIYAFIQNGNIYLGNYLDVPITITSVNPDYKLVGCYDKIDTSIVVAGFNLTSATNYGDFTQCTKFFPQGSGLLKFKIEEVNYEVQLEDSRPEIIIVSRENIGNQRKVFVKGNFKKGVVH